MEIETTTCPKCHRQGCWTISDENTTGPACFTEYTCKCGYSVFEEFYDCPIHGKMEGSECPRC